MTDPLRLVTVELGDKPATPMGMVMLNNGILFGDTVQAQDLIDMLRRRSKLPDPQLFAWLEANGWSNGQLMIQQ